MADHTVRQQTLPLQNANTAVYHQQKVCQNIRTTVFLEVLLKENEAGVLIQPRNTKIQVKEIEGGLMTRVFWLNCTGAATFNICAAEAGSGRLERGNGIVRHYLFVVFPLFVCSISTICL